MQVQLKGWGSIRRGEVPARTGHTLRPGYTLWAHGLAALVALLSGACARGAPEVVVYTALDREFSEPLFKPFEERHGIRVRPKYDTEAAKTVGLFNLIQIEKARPRCDLFWNNEILHTLRLRKSGLLRPIHPPNADPFPAIFKAPDSTWYGFAARARVLIVNTDLVAEDETPRSILDLTEPRWRGRVGMAKPLFGTTATHAACLFARLGPDRARRFFLDLKANDVQILAGNKQVALSVASGSLAVGLTDTDDAIGELEKGMPVRIVYPDSGEGELGTLFIPNTLAAVRGGPNPAAADLLADYLLSPEVEAALARGPSAQIPLNPAVRTPLRVETPATIQAMEVDFDSALELWDKTAEFTAREFTGP